MFLFHLYLPNDSWRQKEIVAEARELLSANRVERGQKAAFELSLRRLNLLPNDFLIYVWLGSSNFQVPYDVLDTNVDLPPLKIMPASSLKKIDGVVELDYELRIINDGPVAHKNVVLEFHPAVTD
jgi:hypothetical protein